MATLRTIHKRKRRKLMIAAQPCQHRTVRDYADGFYCVWCGVSWNTELWGRAFWDDGDDDECTRWCYGCDEPAWSCVCGEPIDLDELPPEAFMEIEEA